VLITILTLAGVAEAARSSTSVLIDSPVNGASVEIDGRMVGKTPLKPQTVTPGKHTVRLRKLGFLEYSEDVEVRSGQSVTVVADLLPFAGVIVVRAVPKDAQVAIDGKPVGKSPLEVEVKLGKRTITVSAPGHATYNSIIQAEPGQTYLFDPTLKAVSGGDDDLALEPLALGSAKPAAKPGAKARSDDLELEPLAPVASPKANSKQAAKSGGDDLDLEPLALAAPPKAIIAAPVQGPTTQAAGTVEAAQPWYKNYWIWGAAAAVASGIVVGVLVLRGGEATGDGPGNPLMDKRPERVMEAPLAW
jgi:hypothetical protein